MKIVLAVISGILVLFYFVGQGSKVNLSQEQIRDTTIERATSRYWDSDIEDELAMLTYEDRTLVYEFMAAYHNNYVDFYQGKITFRDAIFYQKLTGNIPIQDSRVLALDNTIQKQYKEIEALKAEKNYYRQAYENAKKAQQVSQPQVVFVQPNNELTNSSKLYQDKATPKPKRIDKESVYRNYGVYDLEEQLRRARLLDLQDPKWKLYQTDSPRTQEIRRLLLEAREAADRSMR